MDSKYIWPITPKYKVAEHDKYGIRKNHYVLFKEIAHSGFDITADIGTEVHPIMSGTVLLAEFDGTTTEGSDAFNDGYGNKVEILNDDGRRVVYGHLREILVKQGDKVTTETIIGKTGLAYTIDPLEVLPKIDLNSLTKEFTLEPYASLWRKLTSNEPWNFSKEDIPYSDDKNYIR